MLKLPTSSNPSESGSSGIAAAAITATTRVRFDVTGPLLLFGRVLTQQPLFFHETIGIMFESNIVLKYMLNIDYF